MEQFKAKSDGGKGDVITLIQLTGREQVLGKVTDVHEAMIVSADAVRTSKTEVADDDDAPAVQVPAPVQAVAHRTSARKKRKKPAPSSVINADGVFPATSETGGASAPATSAAENDARTVRGEPNDFSSR
jgi:hypothetical protein